MLLISGISRIVSVPATAQEASSDPLSYVTMYKGTNTATITSNQVGDIFFAWAIRDGSSTAPTIPSGVGWNTLLSSGANTLGYALAWKEASTSSETVGTFSNATTVLVAHYRPSSGYSITVGTPVAAGSSSSTSVSFPALTLQATNNTSWVIGFLGHRSSDIGDIEEAPTGMTYRDHEQDATDTAAIYDTNGAVSSWTSQSAVFTGTASAIRAVTLEILVTSESIQDLTNFDAEVSSDTITLSWTDNNGGMAETEIQRSTDGGSNWSILTTKSAGVNTHDDVGLEDGTYHYRARAKIGTDYSNYSSDNATVSTVQSPPTSFSATGGSSSVSLSWTNPSGSIATYIERSPNGSTGWEEIDDVGAGVTAYNDTGLAEATYYYRIRAYNGSIYSTYVSANATVTSAAWQLASGHWVPRKVNMRIVHPSASAGVNAQCRNAYPGIPWTTPISVQGGAYPYRYELVNAPAGMTVGSTLNVSGDTLVPGSDYGVISWPNPVLGSYSITINVYDQDYNRGASPSSVASVTLSLSVNTSNFVFISSSGSNSNPGTFAEPLQTTYALHNGNSATSTHNGKTVYLMGGTHNLYGMPTNSTRYAMISGGAPNTFVGYPGQSVTLNMFEGFVAMNSGSTDMTFKDMTIQCAGDWTDDQYMFWVVASTNRHTWHNITFQNFYGGTGTESNNQAVVFYGNNGCQDVSFTHCNFTGRMGCLVDLYNVRYFVFAHNRGYSMNTTQEVNGANSHNLIYMKDSCLDMSIRANNFYDTITSGHGSFAGCGGQNDGNASYSFNNIEICYNKLAMFNNASLRGYYEYGDGPVGAVYGYRNSCLGDIEDFVHTHNQGPTPNVWESNVAVGGIANMWNATLTDNTTGAGTLDSSANLLGATRTSYLGTIGAEVA